MGPATLELPPAVAAPAPAAEPLHMVDFDLEPPSSLPSPAVVVAGIAQTSTPLPALPELPALDLPAPLAATAPVAAEAFAFDPSPGPAPAPDAPPPKIDFDFGAISLDLQGHDPITRPAPLEEGGVADLELADDAAAAEGDPMARKIELADEFRRIGDHEGARELLEEVVAKAEGPLRERARGLLDNLG